MNSVEFLYLMDKIDQVYKTLLLITDSDKEEYEKHIQKYHINSKIESLDVTQEVSDNKKFLEQIEELENFNSSLLQDNDALLQENNEFREKIASFYKWETDIKKAIDDIYMDFA